MSVKLLWIKCPVLLNLTRLTIGAIHIKLQRNRHVVTWPSCDTWLWAGYDQNGWNKKGKIHFGKVEYFIFANSVCSKDLKLRMKNPWYNEARFQWLIYQRQFFYKYLVCFIIRYCSLTNITCPTVSYRIHVHSWGKTVTVLCQQQYSNSNSSLSAISLYQ